MDTATDRLTGIVAFLQGAERLKDTLRSGHTGQGRRESVAEHSWRLCLFAMLLERDTDVDLLKLLKLCVIHDLGEAISGDVPATDQCAGDGREARERADFLTLCAPLPEDLRTEMAALWDEYAGAASPEARMAKGLDKIETILQHVAGSNPDDFDYAFNLDYGRARTEADPILKALRELADRATRARMDGG
ncbi:HD domain-containing protein [Roseivivax sediminis]|uniref:Putative hydrolases of HD superfamily n=1 Tax=Roseivivax sediminis TaxID=936889 RepID=A0A1I1UCK9_9RHOB|nr:HD domain-containing protein [Roseivivax sediminis]SFD68345.1 putative hydrolases of HD superfamily [Roseivivax sediminis]